MKTIFIIASLAVFPARAITAALKTTVPSQVCGFLVDLGLRNGTWKKQSGTTFGCLSPYKELGAANPLANNLAYYVEGNSGAVTEVKLVLNVNNRGAAGSAHTELLKAAEVLSLKATGQQLTQPLRDAIQQGKKASTKLGASTVEVLRDDWPTGKGYEVHVTIK